MKVIIHVGLDVHNDSIAVSLAPSDSTEVRRWGVLGGTHEHVRKLLQQRQEGQPKAVTDAAWEARRRLHHRYKQMSGPGRKKMPVVIAAVARELSGFVWAIARQVQPHERKR